MSYFTEEMKRNLKGKFESSIRSVREGLQGLQDIREVIAHVKQQEEPMQTLAAELEATLQHLEQEFKKL